MLENRGGGRDKVDKKVDFKRFGLKILGTKILDTKNKNKLLYTKNVLCRIFKKNHTGVGVLGILTSKMTRKRR